MSGPLFLGILAIFALGSPARSADGAPARPAVTIGSKQFTESVVLGEIAAILARDAGCTPRHRAELGGTRILFNSLVAGAIDVYPEYTGTIAEEILAGERVGDEDAMRSALARRGLRMSRPLGFNNTYAVGMRKARATELGIARISDLREHPELAFGFTNEFMDRGDGWPALRDRYGLPQRDVRGLDHDLAYRALSSGAIDATDLYTTDAEIAYYDLAVLNDDMGHFPEYQAVWLYRADLAERAPDFVAALGSLAGRIDAGEMIRMNARAKLEKVPERAVAGDFLAAELGIASRRTADTVAGRVLRRTGEHLALVGISLGAAIFCAIPLGIAAARNERVGQVILGIVGALQTIPSLALLVLMIPLLGIGAKPAIAALFLYSLLPIARNTYSGLRDIPAPVRESAAAIGLPAGARLVRVELPLAARTILAGIKTAAVINVGTATLGALIGAGGYGQPILTGIRLDDLALILEGAIPAVALAFAMQGLFEVVERLVVPRGLRFRTVR